MLDNYGSSYGRNSYGGGYGRGYNPYRMPANTGSMLNFGVNAPTYIGRPVDKIGDMLGKLDAQNKDNFNKASALDIAMSNLDVNPLDEGVVQRQRDMFNQGINDLTSEGDYRIAPARISKLYSNFAKNKELKTALANQQSYNKYMDDVQGSYDKGRLSNEQYQRDINTAFTPTVADEVSGNFIPTRYNMSPYQVDVNSIANKVVNAMPTNTIEGIPLAGIDIDNPAHIPYFTKGTTKYKEVERMRNAIKANILAEPGAEAFIKDQADAMGMDGEEYLNNILEAHMGYGAARQNDISTSLGNTAQLATAGYKAGLKGDAQYSGTPYVLQGMNVPGKQNILTDMENQFGEASWVDKLTRTKQATGAGKGPFSIEPSALPESTKSFVNNYLKNVAGVDYDVNNIDNPQEFLSGFREYMKNFQDKIVNPGGQSYTYDYSKELAEEKIGSSNGTVTRSSRNENYPMSTQFTNDWIFDPATGEVIDGAKFIEMINKNEIEHFAKDNSLTFRVMAPINGGNEIGKVTGNYNFVDGDIFNVNGKEYVVASKHLTEGTGQKVIGNLAQQAVDTPGQPIDASNLVALFIDEDKRHLANGAYMTVDESGNPILEVPGLTDEQVTELINNIN